MPSTTTSQRPLNILIVDDVSTSSTSSRISYTDFVTLSEARLFIVTSKNALSKKDRTQCAAFVEIACPTTDGTLELIALTWHAQHKIDLVYCKQESLLLRAAHLRQLLGIKEELQPDQCHVLCDKFLMKQSFTANNGNKASPLILAPHFKRIFTPACLLSFIDKVGYPIVVKPKVSNGSTTTTIIRNHADLQVFLANDFFGSLNAKGMNTGSPDGFLAEKYLEDAPLFQVNGYMHDGKLVHVWPFQYLRTNFGLGQELGHGNVSIPPRDPLYASLVKATRDVVVRMDKPRNLMFHLELFQVTAAHVPHLVNGDSAFSSTRNCFALCKITTHHPGSSIATLIENLVGLPFQKLEFRLNCGLSSTESIPPVTKITGDIMIPNRPYTLLAHVPTSASFPFSAANTSTALVVDYRPLAKTGQVFTTRHANTPTTVARFMTTASAEFTSFEAVVVRLLDCETWFNSNVVYIDLAAAHQQHRSGALTRFRLPQHLRKAMREATKAYNTQRQLVPLDVTARRDGGKRSRSVHNVLVHKTRERIVKDTSDRQLIHLRTQRRTRHILVHRAVRSIHASRLPTQSGQSLAMVIQSRRPSHVIVHKILRKFRTPYGRLHGNRFTTTITARVKQPILLPPINKKRDNQLVSLREGRMQSSKILLKRVERKLGGGIDWMQGRRYVVVGSNKKNSNNFNTTPKKMPSTVLSLSTKSVTPKQQYIRPQSPCAALLF